MTCQKCKIVTELKQKAELISRVDAVEQLIIICVKKPNQERIRICAEKIVESFGFKK